MLSVSDIIAALRRDEWWFNWFKHTKNGWFYHQQEEFYLKIVKVHRFVRKFNGHSKHPMNNHHSFTCNTFFGSICLIFQAGKPHFFVSFTQPCRVLGGSCGETQGLRVRLQLGQRDFSTDGDDGQRQEEWWNSGVKIIDPSWIATEKHQFVGGSKCALHCWSVPHTMFLMCQVSKL